MKKIICSLVTLLMLASILQVNVVEALENTQNATFISNRFIPVGYEQDGTALDDGVLFPWEKPGENCWGRAGYGMPNAQLAILSECIIDDHPARAGSSTPTSRTQDYYHNELSAQYGKINIPVPLDVNGNPLPQPIFDTDGNEVSSVITAAEPLFWTEFYIDVNQAGGKSQETNHWYVVYDSAGQLWFDSDGYFNDCRYYEYANPKNLYSTYGFQFDSAGTDLEKYLSTYNENNDCKSNPKAYVDPIGSNNTQGPYYLNPQHPMFNGEVDQDGIPRIYFWDKQNTGKHKKCN